MNKAIEKLKAYKFPFLILLLGVALMLVPSAPGRTSTPENSLEEALSLMQGVGEVYVLISEKGVVVVCEGADSAQTRLEIVKAVRTFTGFGADQITVLKRNR